MRSIWHHAMTGFMVSALIPRSAYAAYPEKPVRPPVKGLARRQFLYLTAGTVTLPTSSRIAAAQVYPSRPITMIVPFAAGGPTDAVARIMAKRMGASLAQPVIIENVTGADGTIGAGRTARARPDGYTIELSSMSAHVLNGAFYSLPFDLMNDFTPIAPLLKATPIIVGRKTFPAKDLGELIAG